MSRYRRVIYEDRCQIYALSDLRRNQSSVGGRLGKKGQVLIVAERLQTGTTLTLTHEATGWIS